MLLSTNKVCKDFQQGKQTLKVLKDISFKVNSGKAIGLIGSSGSGKSTLLHIIGLLDTSTSGELLFEGVNVEKLSEKDRTRIRLESIGFVYQFHHLLPEFSAVENVMLPQKILGVSHKLSLKNAEEWLVKLGLKDRLNQRPQKLSGGEQQRVAIARALVNNPKLLIADEPTGNLDNQTAVQVFAELMILIKENNLATIIATHDMSLTKHLDEIFELKNNRLSKIKY